MVVETLRNHLGDENLDLSIGVLYEFIEVNDTSNTWEESSAFRRWAHDHSLRKTDFCNAHVPRLGNIVVGNIRPTERLQQWREQQKQQQTDRQTMTEPTVIPSRSVELARVLVPKTIGIRNRPSWLIEHSVYVSNPLTGTDVLYSPTEEEFAKLASDESYGRGKMVEERVVLTDRGDPLGTPVYSQGGSSITTDGIASIDSAGSKKPSIIKKGCQAIMNPLLQMHFKKKGKGTSMNAWLLCSVNETTIGQTNSDSCPENLLGRSSSLIQVQSQASFETPPLPANARVNGIFSRKFGLVENEPPTSFETVALDCAEEKVLRDAATRKQHLLDKYGKDIPLRSLSKDEFGSIGPFTAELFKDGGLDYRWKPKTRTES